MFCSSNEVYLHAALVFRFCSFILEQIFLPLACTFRLGHHVHIHGLHEAKQLIRAQNVLNR